MKYGPARLPLDGWLLLSLCVCIGKVLLIGNRILQSRWGLGNALHSFVANYPYTSLDKQSYGNKTPYPGVVFVAMVKANIEKATERRFRWEYSFKQHSPSYSSARNYISRPKGMDRIEAKLSPWVSAIVKQLYIFDINST